MHSVVVPKTTWEKPRVCGLLSRRSSAPSRPVHHRISVAGPEQRNSSAPLPCSAVAVIISAGCMIKLATRGILTMIACGPGSASSTFVSSTTACSRRRSTCCSTSTGAKPLNSPGRRLTAPCSSPSTTSCSNAVGATVLIDAGAGNTMQPTLGKLPDNLRAGGLVTAGRHPYRADPSPPRPCERAGRRCRPCGLPECGDCRPRAGARFLDVGRWSRQFGDGAQDPRPQPRSTSRPTASACGCVRDGEEVSGLHTR